MRFAQRPAEERAEALRRVCVVVDKVDNGRGLMIIRIPGFPGLHGVYVVGFLALRFLVWHLGLKQPRRFKGEDRVPTAEELEHIGKHPRLFQGQEPAVDWGPLDPD